MSKKYIITTAGLILISLFIQACKDIEIESTWSDDHILIDGIDNEWSGSYKIIEDVKVVIGAKNDADYLYLVFKTIDRQIKQKVISNGLTIWIDPLGDKEKDFGIHYPIGMMAWGNTQIYDPDDWGPQDEREKRMKEKSKLMLNEMGIISPYGRSEYDLSINNRFGVEIAFNDSSGALIYEMKIPIESPESSMYMYTLSGKTKLSVGIETGKIDKEEMIAKRIGGGMPSGGMGGDRSGGMKGKGGGMSGGKSGTMRDMMEPIKFWVNLNLAEKNIETD